MDAEIRAQFHDLYAAAVAGTLLCWEDAAAGALALVIMLDQFPRNMFRGSAAAFAADPLARAAAGRAIDRRFDRQVDKGERQFFYMPHMHSEALADRSAAATCAGLRATSTPSNTPCCTPISSAVFGRFPHRNAALGRVTTPEEQAFLDGGGFAG